MSLELIIIKGRGREAFGAKLIQKKHIFVNKIEINEFKNFCFPNDNFI